MICLTTWNKTKDVCLIQLNFVNLSQTALGVCFTRTECVTHQFHGLIVKSFRI